MALQHELARRQMAGGGGIVSFVIRGGLDGARRFLERHPQGTPDYVNRLRRNLIHRAVEHHQHKYAAAFVEDRKRILGDDTSVEVDTGADPRAVTLAEELVALDILEQESAGG